MLIRALVVALLVLMTLAGTVWAQQDPAAATVFLSVAGRVTAARVLDNRVSAPELELRDVELQTGSGFFFSSLGYVLTNLHVVSGEKIRVLARGFTYEITLEAQKITAVVPSQTPRDPSRSLEASVVATNADLDLAVLFIGGGNWPYVPFGDSDALEGRAPVSVLGYPYGRLLEIGRTSSGDAPAPTVSTGIVSAVRRDDQGERRFVQTSAGVSPGSSGGPMLNRYGFGVGVVNLKVTGESNVAFAIPINVVKDFLGRHGLDSLLPAARLGPISPYEASGKLLSLSLPIGFRDVAVSRTQLDSGDSLGRIFMRVDRVMSPWRPARIIEELVAGRAFESLPARTLQEPDRPSGGARGLLIGLAEGDLNGAPYWILYGVLDLGEEKIVARYVSAAEDIAFNESVLRTSLGGLQATPMLVPTARMAAGLAPLPPSVRSAPVTSVPADWVIEVGAPFRCGGLTAAKETIAASPVGDFAVSFRSAGWPEGIDAAEAARRCAGLAGSVDGAAYRYQFSWLGVDYATEGLFRQVNGRTIQFEMVAPASKAPAFRTLFSTWASEAARK